MKLALMTDLADLDTYRRRNWIELSNKQQSKFRKLSRRFTGFGQGIDGSCSINLFVTFLPLIACKSHLQRERTQKFIAGIS